LRRRWIGIERETKYVEAAQARITSTLPLDESAMVGVPEKASQPRVAFGLLVENGTVAPGTILTDSKRRWHAEVKADGSLLCDMQSGSIHRLGAILQDAPSCNGWTFWHIEDGGALVTIDTLRQKHLAEFIA
jgi:modification methylase